MYEHSESNAMIIVRSTSYQRSEQNSRDEPPSPIIADRWWVQIQAVLQLAFMEPQADRRQ